jgi:hypothetical protein
MSWPGPAVAPRGSDRHQATRSPRKKGRALSREKNEEFIADLHNASFDRFLYHYTRLDTALEHILPERTLRLSPFSAMNDPRESSDWQFTPLKFPTVLGVGAYKDSAVRHANDRLKRTWKVLALTADDPDPVQRPTNLFSRGFARPRMWAYYGGNHGGGCLVFDRAKMIDEVGAQLGTDMDHQWYSSAIDYTDDFNADTLTLSGEEIATHGLEQAVQVHQVRHYASLFFQKNRDWATEYEYRFVVQRLDDFGYLFVSVSQSLVGMVLGRDVPDVCAPTVDEAAQRAVIGVGQLDWRNGVPRLDIPTWERPMWFEGAR